jgi:hypothetical protein
MAQSGGAQGCRQYRHVLRRLSPVAAVLKRHADRAECTRRRPARL